MLYNTYCKFYQRYFYFIMDISFIGRGNWRIGTKTTDMLQVGNKDLSHYILSSIPHIDLHVSKLQFEVMFYYKTKRLMYININMPYVRNLYTIIKADVS